MGLLIGFDGQKFSEQGFNIAAVVSPGSVPKITETDLVKSFPADLLDEKIVEQTVSSVFSKFVQVEMAVFTVGGFAMGNLEETGAEDFDKMYRLNRKTYQPRLLYPVSLILHKIV